MSLQPEDALLRGMEGPELWKPWPMGQVEPNACFYKAHKLQRVLTFSMIGKNQKKNQYFVSYENIGNLNFSVSLMNNLFGTCVCLVAKSCPSPALAGRFFTTEPPGNAYLFSCCLWLCCLCCLWFSAVVAELCSSKWDGVTQKAYSIYSLIFYSLPSCALKCKYEI